MTALKARILAALDLRGELSYAALVAALDLKPDQCDAAFLDALASLIEPDRRIVRIDDGATGEVARYQLATEATR